MEKRGFFLNADALKLRLNESVRIEEKSRFIPGRVSKIRIFGLNADKLRPIYTTGDLAAIYDFTGLVIKLGHIIELNI